MIKAIINFMQIIKRSHLYKKQENARKLSQLHLQGKLETALLSEFSLQKDWLTPEEDEAWKHL